MITSQTLWLNTREFVRQQLPNATDDVITEVTIKIYNQMKFLVGYKFDGDCVKPKGE